MEVKNSLVGQVSSLIKSDKSKEAKSAVEANIAKSENKDTLDTTPVKNESVTYENPAKAKYSAIVEEAIKMSDERYASLKQLVKDLVERQGGTFNDISDVKNIKFADKETIDAAKAELEGDMSVDNLSSTIVDFAKGLAASDPAKAQLLKNAFLDGFKAAESAWGGKLPEISYKTYDAVIKKFDEWENPATADAAQEVATGEK